MEKKNASFREKNSSVSAVTRNLWHLPSSASMSLGGPNANNMTARRSRNIKRILRNEKEEEEEEEEEAKEVVVSALVGTSVGTSTAGNKKEDTQCEVAGILKVELERERQAQV